MKKSAYIGLQSISAHESIYRYYSGKGGKRQMIKVENFGEFIQINGYPEQIAMEFEIIARAVRVAYCKTLGEDAGNDFYEFILTNAAKNESKINHEADELYSRIEKEDPESIRRYMESPVMQSWLQAKGLFKNNF